MPNLHTLLAVASTVTATLVVASSAAAQRQFEILTKRNLAQDPGRTTASVLGDVDGDGDLDVVLGAYPGLQLHLGDGHGTFSDVRPVGSILTRALALADVDGDGDLDLVVGSDQVSSPAVQLFENNGTGTFTNVTATHLPAIVTGAVVALALGDVDGDGDRDLMVGRSGQQSLLLLNGGNGVFTDVTSTRLPSSVRNTTAVVLSDVDGDGDRDLVLGNSAQQSQLWLNDGTGTFTDVTAARLPVAADVTRAVALGDVDGDGDLDLVLANGSSSGAGGQDRLWRNNGAGTFADATSTSLPVALHQATAVALADVDGDGDLDLVVGDVGPEQLCLNNGLGVFTDVTQTRLPAVDDATTSLSVGDVDRDGDLDLVVTNGVANFALPPMQRNRLCLNDGTGTFVDATQKRVPVSDGVLGDVDGDGDLDLVTPEGRLCLNDGRGTFTDVTATRMPSGVFGPIALGDVDGDGDLDIVFGSGATTQSHLFLNNGLGTFTDVTATHLPVALVSTLALALGDVDGDGDLDLVVGNLGGPEKLWLNNGFGIFTDATATRMPAVNDRTTSLALGDVDGDGDLDLVVGNSTPDPLGSTGQQNRLYRNNGSGTFTDATAACMPVLLDATNCLALGDVDGDGDLDLVVGNGSPIFAVQTDRLYLNDGFGTFADATSLRFPSAASVTRALALGDVDGDGDLDLLVGFINPNNPNLGDRLRLFANDGTGTFTDVTSALMPTILTQNVSLALGDVDSDGDLDVVVGTGAPWATLLVNVTRQLDAPFALVVGRDYQFDAYARFGPPRLVDVVLPYFATAVAHLPLPPLGIVGIDPNAMTALPPFLVAQPAGVGSLSVAVPPTPALAGIAVHTQALLVQYPTQDRLTNVVTDVILR